MSAWTWSRGEPAMPPLARYLLHAAKLRHHVRVWQGDEDWLAPLRGQVDTHVDELRFDLTRTDIGDRLRGDEAGLVVAADRVERMRKSVEIARWNMAKLQDRPLVADEDSNFRVTLYSRDTITRTWSQRCYTPLYQPR
ncbi:CATRA conflict system CASPASE/TPR repeat-associated protein [Saccharothrix texasensis]|uniref:CATRA conflict system CASPASE/TPR repeat-associated protein n=1 Tax=Saccharothrix texasensis TaxID=103734 RepID=UPI0024823F6B|nr:CATRA conflict system CASPASE/TPR repeat-associated protein [Saccharothrix texasensis]